MAVDRSNLRRVVAGSALAVTAIQTATAWIGLRHERRDYADAAWGPGLAAVSLVGAAVGTGDPVRRGVLALGATAWATRLSTLMARRLRGSDSEDARYTEFLDGDGTGTVLTKVFLTQGAAQLLVSAPVQLAAASALPAGRRRWLLPVGVGVMAAGAVIEAVADRQKARYTELDEEEKPAVLDTGLWGWSRHPNYFGDSLFWDGVWVCAAASTPGGWTWPAPAAMSYFLVFATGARRTERRMQDRPAYQDYQRRVSFFIPRPPSKRVGTHRA